MIKLKCIKTAQAIKNYESHILFADKFDMTYYPNLNIVDVFWKQRNYRCFVSIPNIAYMEPIDECVSLEQENARANSPRASKEKQQGAS